MGSPYFSPQTHHGERFLDTRFQPPTVAPGKTRGCSVSPALSCISLRGPLRRQIQALNDLDRAKGSAGTFQRGRFSAPLTLLRRKLVFSNFAVSLHTQPASYGTLQAWINSRNQITIAIEWKHRQHYLLRFPHLRSNRPVRPRLSSHRSVFLGPLVGLANYHRTFCISMQGRQTRLPRLRLAESVSILYTKLSILLSGRTAHRPWCGKRSEWQGCNTGHLWPWSL